MDRSLHRAGAVTARRLPSCSSAAADECLCLLGITPDNTPSPYAGADQHCSISAFVSQKEKKKNNNNNLGKLPNQNVCGAGLTNFTKTWLNSSYNFATYVHAGHKGYEFKSPFH